MTAPTAAAIRDRVRSRCAAGPICVVDDDASICDSLAALLEIYGFEVITFSSGAEFLADERHRAASFIIIDHHMPGMDGLDVISALLQEGISVPAILITGRLEPSVRERADELSVVAVIEKPFTVAQLIERIRSGGTRADDRRRG